MKKSTIKKKDKKIMAADPFYKCCALFGQFNHICGGNITWEHAIIFNGSKVQDPWAIIPLCEKAHSVNRYQDGGDMVKERNVWVALNRATDDELKVVSKSTDYIRMRGFLNNKYGVYQSKSPDSQDIQY